jgi:hypothetical protein
MQQMERRIWTERKRLGNPIGESWSFARCETTLRFQFGGPVAKPSWRLTDQNVPPDCHLNALVAHPNPNWSQI